jgi:hypothetical protein
MKLNDIFIFIFTIQPCSYAIYQVFFVPFFYGDILCNIHVNVEIYQILDMQMNEEEERKNERERERENDLERRLNQRMKN